ncbi:MAG: hypothetical protein FWG18_04095 [Alphaproteobacteria bacterium]|nr:hypothetical protein [Alphaproteobacteria bacterium]
MNFKTIKTNARNYIESKRVQLIYKLGGILPTPAASEKLPAPAVQIPLDLQPIAVAIATLQDKYTLAHNANNLILEKDILTEKDTNERNKNLEVARHNNALTTAEEANQTRAKNLYGKVQGFIALVAAEIENSGDQK